jgi:hypothetical protein
MTLPLTILNNIGIILYTSLTTIAFEPSRATRYYTDDIVGDIKSNFVIKCWENIKFKIIYTLIYYILNLANKDKKIFHSIKDISVDFFSIRIMVIEVI